MPDFSQVALGAHFYGIYTFKLASFKNQDHNIVSSWTKIPRIFFFSQSQPENFVFKNITKLSNVE